MGEIRCETCWSYVGDLSRTDRKGRLVNGKGVCHRYPPVVLPDPHGNVKWAHPTVSTADFCGEYRKLDIQRNEGA